MRDPLSIAEDFMAAATSSSDHKGCRTVAATTTQTSPAWPASAPDYTAAAIASLTHELPQAVFIKKAPLLTVAKAALHHDDLRLKVGHGDFGHRELLMVSLLS